MSESTPALPLDAATFAESSAFDRSSARLDLTADPATISNSPVDPEALKETVIRRIPLRQSPSTNGSDPSADGSEIATEYVLDVPEVPVGTGFSAPPDAPGLDHVAESGVLYDSLASMENTALTDVRSLVGCSLAGSVMHPDIPRTKLATSDIDRNRKSEETAMEITPVGRKA